MRHGLENLTVIITGASGGIGEALANTFGEAGCRLALFSRSRHASLAEYVASHPWRDRAMSLSVDIRDNAAVERALLDVRESFGRADVCIVNAGIWPTESLALHEQPVRRIREVVETNLLGAAFTARAFLESLAVTGPRADDRGASLCFVGSTAGRFGEAGHSEYAMSKAALLGLVRSLKNEIVALDRYGRVNMVEPGWTATPMAAQALADHEALRSAISTMPLQQIARAQDIANAVAFLSSPALARHVSGEVLTVAGGMEGRRQWRDAEIDVAAVIDRLQPDDHHCSPAQEGADPADDPASTPPR
ncbi:MAG: SDR family oxidoreductase [Myxococcales bacterium FL481]|nr:MAG: SDR family oxidoreductase [Myxococcales bacterium FL481]